MNLSQIRPLPEDFVERCKGVSNKTLMRHYGCGHSTMARWRAEVGIPCTRWRGGNDPRPMPDDFKEHAPTAKNPDLAARYSTSITMIQRWRREAGIRGTAKANRKGRRPKMRAPMPDDFAELARTHFNHQLCKKYGVGMKLVSRWRAECGVAYERPHPPPKPPRQPKPPRERKSKPGVINSMGRGHCVGFAPPRDTTLEGQAAEVLRRLAPCYRCDEMGRQETNRPKDHWRWGMVVMAPDELFARARSKGWEAST